MLLVVGALTVAQWVTRPERARAHRRDPVLSHFHGAAPMALLTVGHGALVLGRDLTGAAAALRIDQLLWTAGTALGLVTAVALPVLLFSVEAAERESGWAVAVGGWLMPVVPPMVSAATGAALLDSTPPGQLRLTLLVACGACFGISLLAALFVVPLIWGRLAGHGLPAPRTLPTLWIVLGPLGQSVTAAGLLAEHGATGP
jgi:tellurite resistance protein TehA-like permease